jgi:small subunit ribosomal protein S7
MPRRAAAGVRPLDPDPVHGSRLVQQVINKVMTDGKKSTAEKIVYDALAILSERTGKDPVEALETSIRLVSRTRATLRSAEFGFLGVVVYTRVHTPRRCGRPGSAAGVGVVTVS